MNAEDRKETALALGILAVSTSVSIAIVWLAIACTPDVKEAVRIWLMG